MDIVDVSNKEMNYPGYNYNSYHDIIGEICRTGDISKFKTYDSYKEILEHVSPKLGYDYLQYIRGGTSISYDNIVEYCNMNDKVGSPMKVQYGDLYVSPSSLRYIFHAHLILKYMQSLNMPSLDIVELGGGYGGLCLAVHYFASMYNLRINSYTIVDLTNPIKLQELYISEVNPSLKVSYVDGSTYGEKISQNDMFLISNYCFSEISSQHQKQYVEKLFPKVSHGFITWNFIPVYNFKPNLKIEDEYPQTGNNNKYVYF
jgi:hypothetical protein